jgi:sugar O-acyltransferase (sialic acid O-acetyltransferase NeuD family)
MRKILIIGAGGWGREVLDQLCGDPARCVEWNVKGFLDSRAHMLDGFNYDYRILGDPMTYVPQPDDVFVCAVGSPRDRQKYARPLLDKGATFIPILTDMTGHRPSLRIGNGCLLSPRVQLGSGVRLGDFVNVHSLTILGHDVQVGDYAQIGAMNFIGGGARIGAFAVLHPHATVLPGVQIGDEAVVGAGAVVLKDVPAGATVFGNPGKIIFQK